MSSRVMGAGRPMRLENEAMESGLACSQYGGLRMGGEVSEESELWFADEDDKAGLGTGLLPSPLR